MMLQKFIKLCFLFILVSFFLTGCSVFEGLFDNLEALGFWNISEYDALNPESTKATADSASNELMHQLKLLGVATPTPEK